MTMFDEDYPSRATPPDPRPGPHANPPFDIVSMWENGEVRHVSSSGASTNGLPPFPNQQGCETQGES